MKCFGPALWRIGLALLLSLGGVQQVIASETPVSMSSSNDEDTLSVTYQPASPPKLYTAPRYILFALEKFGDHELPNLSSDGIEFIHDKGNLLVLIARRDSLSWNYSLGDSGSARVQVRLNPAEFASQQFPGVSLQVLDQFRSMTFEEVESSEMQRVAMGVRPVDRLLVMLSDYSDYMDELIGLVERGDISEEIAVERAEKARKLLLKEWAVLGKEQ